MKKEVNLLSHAIGCLFFIFLCGLIAWVWLASESIETYKNDPTSLLIMLAFFVLVVIVFIAAGKMLRKGRKIQSELIRVASEIESLSESEKADYLTKIENKVEFFQQDELNGEFRKFLNDLKVVSQVSKETKINIRSYINYDLIDEAISMHYLSQVSGIMTSLGILGTFVGLSIGLNAFDLSGNAQELESKIVPLMDGIKVAFHTSICGLIYSILYNLYYRHSLSQVRDAVDRFIEAFEKNVILLSENGSNNTFAKYQERMCETMGIQTENQNSFYSQYDAKSQMMVDSLKHQECIMDKILEGQNEFYMLQNDKTRLLVESMQHQGGVLDNLVDSITQQIAGMMHDIIVPSLSNMTETVRRFAEMTQKNQLEGLEQVVDAFIQNMNSSLGDSFAELGTVINETNSWQKKSLSQMEDTLDRVNGMALEMSSINEAFAGIIYSIEKYEKEVSILQERVVESVDSVNKQIELNNLSIEKQTEGVNELLKNSLIVSDKIGDFITSARESVDHIEAYNERLTAVLDTKLAEADERMKEGYSTICDCMNETQKQYINSMTDFTTSANEKLIRVGELVESQMKALFETSEKVSNNMENQVEIVALKSKEINEQTLKDMANMQTEFVRSMDTTREKFTQGIEEMYTEFANKTKELTNSVIENMTKTGELAKNQYHDMLSKNENIFESMEKQLQTFATQSENMCEKACDKIAEIHEEFTCSMDDIAEETVASIHSCVDGLNERLGHVLNVNRDITESINKAADGLGEAARKFGSNTDAKITKTFATFDAELTTITKHFGAAIHELEKTIDKVPVVVEDVYGDVDQKFESIRKTLDEYLEYADKLHRDLEFKWKQLREEMGKNN